MDWSAFTWMYPPHSADEREGHLHVITGDRGDFWHETFYGFRHHNGHFLHLPVQADFTAELRFQADFAAQYDQAGLMIWLDETHWIKCGIEYVGGVAHLAVVVTNGQSDWSQMPLPGAATGLDLRLTRVRDAVWVQYLADQSWKMVRLAAFPPRMPAMIGPMCCSPSRAGLHVIFERFALGPPASKDPY